MPPIQRRVCWGELRSLVGEGRVGSKAERLGGTKWRVPGWELAGRLDSASMLF